MASPKITFFSSRSYDRDSFVSMPSADRYTFDFQEAGLTESTASLALGADAVCLFVNDKANAPALRKLAECGIRVVVLRCAGTNQIDMAEARRLGIRVARVPAYSPHAVAEHTLALCLALNRKTHRAYNRVKESNFSLQGLLGFDLNGKTAGILGMGKIGLITARLFRAFGCRVLAFDVSPSADARAEGFEFVDVDTLLTSSDIISLHCPLNAATYHLINPARIEQMKDGVMLINTGRGGLIDSTAVIAGLKSGKIGYLGLDVYEEEEILFFVDRSDSIPQDEVFSRLLSFPNVLITGHQAFFTREALHNIADTTLCNLDDLLAGRTCMNEVNP